ncbi:MAG TPA: Gfo/Idh/MocA family oxidoreductase [Candidatus Hydrogenedentes bacterium]|nr:Gfo/Idh/MocA family oxidoreductase [Candidatus Hydrogenedentota bacterium]
MKPMNRRAFLGTGMGLTAAAIASSKRPVFGAANKKSPNERLNIAGIGIGGMGGGNLRNMAKENIVALCDVDQKYAAKTFAQYPKAVQYTDYRVMLEKQNDIDAVMIATPDHTHAVISMAAMQAGKHVYCQKPLTHTVFESRKLAQAAKETGVCTQMGIQGHSMKDARLICEWIDAGVLGQIREVIAWCSLTYYPWGHAGWSSPMATRPAEMPDVPTTLNWDLFIGPAPMRPYHPCYHPAVWRSWWDFGCGMMGDRGAHTIDPIFWSLKLGHPISIEASNTDLNPETYPIASVVRYQFPARDDLPPVTLTWYDGLQPPAPLGLGDTKNLGDGEGGALFIGDKACLTCGTYGNSPRLIPEAKMKDFTPPPETIPRIKGSHEEEWIDACKNGRPADADFSYSGPLTEAALLGNIAKRLPGQTLQWDGESMTFPNSKEATAFVKTQYRDGWTL